jgi:hypothetical protein
MAAAIDLSTARQDARRVSINEPRIFSFAAAFSK